MQPATTARVDAQQVGRVAALVQSLAVGLAEAGPERSEQKRGQEVSEFGAAVHDQTSSATKMLGAWLF